jgi:sec-independent protein translocase protein TatA
MSLLRHPGFILVLILLIVLLFGSHRLPDLARSVGQSLKIFKKEVKDLREDDAAPEATAQPAPATPPTADPGSSAGTGDVPPAEGGTPPRA